jgi:hypothetical protein
VIVIHVACEDEAFRAVVAELLGHQRDMRVLRVDDASHLAERSEAPDVVVFGVSPRSEVTQHAPEAQNDSLAVRPSSRRPQSPCRTCSSPTRPAASAAVPPSVRPRDRR